MSARTWLSPRIRRAIVAIHLDTRATPVGWVSPNELTVLVGKYSTNIIKALLHRGLIQELRREATDILFGYELTPAGREHAQRVLAQIRTRMSKSATHQARAG